MSDYGVDLHAHEREQQVLQDDSPDQQKDVFRNLVELDISYNLVDNEQDLMICTSFVSIQMLDITGNPLASRPLKYYENLKGSLHRNISCHLRINSAPKQEDISLKVRAKETTLSKHGHSFSLPTLKHIHLKASLQGYPRPMVIRTKEVKINLIKTLI